MMTEHLHARHVFVRVAGLSLLALASSAGALLAQETAAERPNILFCLADDQSYPHASACGEPVIKTPVFARVAREGVLFTQAYCAAPSCTPFRSAISGSYFLMTPNTGGEPRSVRRQCPCQPTESVPRCMAKRAFWAPPVSSSRCTSIILEPSGHFTVDATETIQ